MSKRNNSYLYLVIILYSIMGNSQDNLSKIKNEILNSDFNVPYSCKIELSELIQPTVGVKTIAKDDRDINIGSSKIGGKPDLPINFNWPKMDNEFLTFCAQYNLEEINIYDVSNKLPASGIIYVFIYIDKEWPVFLNKKNSYKVIFQENTDELIRTEFPLNYFSEGIFEPSKIEYFESYTMPDDESTILKNFQDSYEDFHDFYDSTYEYIQHLTELDIDSFHQVLGYDRSIQSSVTYSFAEIELEITSQDEWNTKKSEILELSKKYQLLLQLETDGNNLDKFGGSSTIYFGIDPKDLKMKNFDNVIMAFQGT
ncbi:DUF1963 domain-containing protein [Maribacter dokdonensis]|uniref:DUF1963 domain-containing protein n=1 Tax=Maribacter dokdonensis TaxID=320912 RepID=UPI001C0812D3|nr:YwqG family protein [Maribacter dokdonensis]MBU2902733.1 DUF1963 domain-containing protein [Maribacter dokdonensis]